MTAIVTDEATWDCACVSEHRPGIGRAWCFDCSEWCYPNDPQMLCVRGYVVVLEAQVKAAEARTTEVLVAHHDVTKMQHALNRMGRCEVCAGLGVA